jgi:hypothetical protein
MWEIKNTRTYGAYIFKFFISYFHNFEKYLKFFYVSGKSAPIHKQIITRRRLLKKAKTHLIVIWLRSSILKLADGHILPSAFCGKQIPNLFLERILKNRPFKTKHLQMYRLQSDSGNKCRRERNIRGSMVAYEGTAIENRTFATEGNYLGEEQEGYGKKVSKDIMRFL